MALATTSDYTEITGETLDGPATTRVERLLGIAESAVLANAHGQTIEQATTTETLWPSGGVVRFPQRPVTDVDAVVYDGVILTADVDYRWTEGGNGLPAYLIRRYCDRDVSWAAPVTVTYTHGWASVPEPLVAAVVFLAQRLKADSLTAGRPIVSESDEIDGYSHAVRYADQADVPIPQWIASTIDMLTAVDVATSMPVVRER